MVEHQGTAGTEVVSLLRKQGMKVTLLHSTAEALDFLRKGGTADLVVTDLGMSNPNGIEFCRTLRSPVYPSMNYIPILAHTKVTPGTDTGRLAMEAGANACLPEPLDPDLFHLTVRGLLHGRTPATPCNVLIVQQDGLFRDQLLDALAESDFTACFAADRAEALRMLKGYKPQIVALNLALDPGRKLLDAFLKGESAPKILALTDSYSPDLPFQALQSGAHTFIPLPVDRRYVVEICRRIRGELSVEALVDMVERKSQQLREDRERHHQLFNGMADTFMLFEVICGDKGAPCDARILEVNPAGEKLFGMDRRELIDKNVSEIASGLLSWLKPLYATGITGVSMQTTVQSDRLNKHLEIATYSPKPRQFAAIIRDETMRWKATDALATEKGRLLVTLQNIGDGVLTIDAAGCIQLCNKHAEALTGWPAAESLGKHMSDVLHLVRESDSTRIPVVEQITGDTTRVSVEGVLLSRHGTNALVQVNGAPISGVHGELAGAVVVIRDVTGQRRLQTERERAQRIDVMGLVAAGIAHDFNNYLMTIVGNLSLAKSRSDVGMDPELADLLKEAESASLRARSLTQQMLTFSKEGVPVKHAVRIKELVEESARFVLRGSNCGCTFALSEDLWTGDVDASQISQIIQNIAINAWQAMPGGGKVRITGENVRIKDEMNSYGLAPGRYVKISISDTGIGMPLDVLKRVFEPYFTTKKEGSGLGLATSYSIAKRHGGCITAESVPEKGSRFDIYLPTTEGPVEKVDSDIIQDDSGGKKILILDDDDSIHRLLSRMLRTMGYQTASAWNGAEAVRMYKKAMDTGQPFDIVILDLTVPGQMGAAETVVALHNLDPSVKAIITSGRTDDPTILNWKDRHFSGVLLKPFHMKELAELLRRVAASAS